MTEGWKCPSCGAVYAPFVARCWDCPPSVSVFDTGATNAFVTYAVPLACPGCGKWPCEGSGTACPLPQRTRVVV